MTISVPTISFPKDRKQPIEEILKEIEEVISKKNFKTFREESSFEDLLVNAEEVEINERGEIVPKGSSGKGIEVSYHVFYGFKSRWFCFLSSVDKEKDHEIIKELLFWSQIYHQHDVDLTILVSGFSGDQYNYFLHVFDVKETPTLVLTDPSEYSLNIRLSPEFFSESVVGQSCCHLGDVMEFLHLVLMRTESLKRVKRELEKYRKIDE